VEVEVTPADQARLAGHGQVDPVAYNKYLQARYLLDTWSPEEMLLGLDLMREALEIDPESAMIHAGLAIGLQYAAWFNFVEPMDVAEEARRSAIKATELDPESSHAWTAQGAVSYYLDFDIPSGISALEKALELQPGDQQALIHLGWLLGEAGQFDQSFSLAQKSIELDPFSAVAHGALAQAKLLAGDSEEALKGYEKVLELDRRDPSAYFFLTWPHLQLGNVEKAIEYARVSVELSGGAPLYRAGLAYVLAINGQKTEARATLSELRAENAPPILLAEIYLGLGELENSLDHLEQAFNARNATLMYIFKSTRFDPLRGHPRFEALIDRMGWNALSFE
jgi:tetratricopeptide (TPR) repeat protein